MEAIYRDGSRRRVLAGGRETLLPPYTYNADGLATVHDASFLADARFRAAYDAGAHSGHRICPPEQLHMPALLGRSISSWFPETKS